MTQMLWIHFVECNSMLELRNHPTYVVLVSSNGVDSLSGAINGLDVSLGIFELLNVKSTIAATSCVHADHVSKIVGVPVAPSYVPGSEYLRIICLQFYKSVVQNMIPERKSS